MSEANKQGKSGSGASVVIRDLPDFASDWFLVCFIVSRSDGLRTDSVFVHRLDHGRDPVQPLCIELEMEIAPCVLRLDCPNGYDFFAIQHPWSADTGAVEIGVWCSARDRDVIVFGILQSKERCLMFIDAMREGGFRLNEASNEFRAWWNDGLSAAYAVSG